MSCSSFTFQVKPSSSICVEKHLKPPMRSENAAIDAKSTICQLLKAEEPVCDLNWWDSLLLLCRFQIPSRSLETPSFIWEGQGYDLYRPLWHFREYFVLFLGGTVEERLKFCNWLKGWQWQDGLSVHDFGSGLTDYQFNNQLDSWSPDDEPWWLHHFV